MKSNSQHLKFLVFNIRISPCEENQKEIDRKRIMQKIPHCIKINFMQRIDSRLIYFDELFQNSIKNNSMMSYLNLHIVVRWILITVSLHLHCKNSSIMDCSLLFSSFGVPKAKADQNGHLDVPRYQGWAIHNNDHCGRSYSSMFPKGLRN